MVHGISTYYFLHPLITLLFFWSWDLPNLCKENFKEIGGQASRNAPLGWNGKPENYKEDWMGTDDCY